MNLPSRVLFALVAFVSFAAAQQSAPVITPQLNTDLFVGQIGYPTIQSTVSRGCNMTGNGFRVVIPAGAAPPDTVTQVSGCAKVLVVDQRSAPVAIYSWNATTTPPAYQSQTTQFNGGTVLNPIVLPGDPTQPLQAATKQYTDGRFAQGGAVSNPITLPADPASALQAATKQYADQAGLLGTTAANIAPTAAGAIAANQQQFTDGTNYWCAGTIYCPNGIYIDDFTLTVLANPKMFSVAQITNIVNKFMGQVNAGGDIPLVLNPSGLANVAGDFYSGFDLYQKHASGDGWICIPLLIDQVYQQNPAAGIALYTQWIGAWRTAVGRVPRNATTKLMTVNAGDEYVAGSLFMEVMRSTGDVALANVWYERDVQALGAIATAAGDTANAAFLASEQINIDAGIKANLIDATSGMLKTATGQNSANLDTRSTVLWVHFHFATAAQQTAAASYLASNYSTFVNAAGYLRNSPTPWASSGCIPASGGAPYTPVGTAPCYAGAGLASPGYQWGYWSDDFQWFAETLALANPVQAQTLVSTFSSSPFLNQSPEWYAVGSAQPGGTQTNMESNQGALAYAKAHPAAALPGANYFSSAAPPPSIGYGTTTPNVVYGVTLPASSIVHQWLEPANAYLRFYGCSGSCEEHLFDVATGNGFGWVAAWNGNTPTYILSYHQTGVSPDVSILSCAKTGCAVPGVISYGVPSVDTASLNTTYGITLLQPASGWAKQDNIFEISAVIPSGTTVPANTEFARIDLGKHPTDGNGNAYYPTCAPPAARLPNGSAAINLTYSGSNGALGGAPATYSLFTAPGQTIAGGQGTMVWVVTCAYIAEQ